MMDSIKLTNRVGMRGCGVYEIGESYCRLFITDGQRVLPITGHHLTEDDLMTVFQWGWDEGQKAAGIETIEVEEGDSDYHGYPHE